MFKIIPVFKFSTKFPFLLIRWFALDEEKFLFSDDILNQLAKEPEFQNEDYVAPIVCNNLVDIEIFGKIYTPKDFIPKDKERLYFRNATLYLESKNLIIVDRTNPINPKYLISYEGLILVKNGGIIKDLRNTHIKDFLQKAVWFVAILTFFVSTLLSLFHQDSNKCDCHIHLSVSHK
ncbi:hypothetical protein [Flavobacterium sp. UMI-01]|uniref:hypothetical protein n=1 Tax=Flavobacterium sp. UMI-01 TaxID=1441053 RepID=UPI001C7CD8C4|nr:hypothetical protein [Flavobacterium sp. UMI-01]GIZ10387.1 hypothetical protein FUMI01_31110 [Flavobacterium sp. UMI-01]